MGYRVLGLLGLLGGAALAAELPLPGSDSIEIEDADTLLVQVDGSGYRIQLVDIDAPENAPNPKLQRDSERTGHAPELLLPLGRAADDALRRLLAESAPYRLQFDADRRDRYGRVPGDLLDQHGRRLSERLVAAGYAVPLPGAAPERQAALAAALDAARSAPVGLWASHPALVADWAGLPPR